AWAVSGLVSATITMRRMRNRNIVKLLCDALRFGSIRPALEEQLLALAGQELRDKEQEGGGQQSQHSEPEPHRRTWVIPRLRVNQGHDRCDAGGRIPNRQKESLPVPRREAQDQRLPDGLHQEFANGVQQVDQDEQSPRYLGGIHGLDHYRL